MAILTSTIIEDRAQPGGRRYVTERHTRDDGPDVLVSYLAEAADNVTARMLARVADLAAQLADEADARTKAPIIVSIFTKLSAFNQSRSDVVLQASVGAGGAGLTLGERIIYRAITS